MDVGLRGGADTSAPPSPLLALDSIEKWYAGTPALSGASLDCRPGEVHALIGENGSGKSTLLKVASGEVHPDAGRIEIEGSPVRFRQPRDAIRAGVALIAQEVPLCRALTVAENISLGALPVRPLGVDWRACRRTAMAALERLGEDFDVSRNVDTLSADERQLVAIARALARGQRILLLDEPTSSLSLEQATRLFGVLRNLRGAGIAMVYVTQRLAELEEVADRVTVIRDGKVVALLGAGDIDQGRIAELMIGRKLEGADSTGRAPVAGRESGEGALLAVEDLYMLPLLRSASLSVHGGEVVGIAGLVGSGASELLEALAGTRGGAEGTVTLGGEPLPLSSVKETMARGVGYLPRDRRLEALVPALSVSENMLLSDLASLWPPMVRSGRRRRARELAQRFSVRAAGLDAPAASLSGGNQQKLVMARVLARDPRLILLNEPTRGVDVGAKLDIFREIRQFATAGGAAMVYSSEFKDLIEWCDRIVVLYRGYLVADRPAGSWTEEGLILLASRGRRSPGPDAHGQPGEEQSGEAQGGSQAAPEGTAPGGSVDHVSGGGTGRS